MMMNAGVVVVVEEDNNNNNMVGGAQYAYLVEARGGVRRALVERPALVRHAVLHTEVAAERGR